MALGAGVITLSHSGNPRVYWCALLATALLSAVAGVRSGPEAITALPALLPGSDGILLELHNVAAELFESQKVLLRCFGGPHSIGKCVRAPGNDLQAV